MIKASEAKPGDCCWFKNRHGQIVPAEIKRIIKKIKKQPTLVELIDSVDFCYYAVTLDRCFWSEKEAKEANKKTRKSAHVK